MNKNILYISYDGLTDTLGRSQILPYLTGLSKKGYSITVLSAEKRTKFEKDCELIRNICRENNINWVYIFYTKKPPIISSILDIYKMIKLAKNIYRKEKFYLVHARSYMASIVAVKLKRKYKIEYIFDMRGFYPDERVDGGIWDLNSWLYKKVFDYFKKKETQFLQEADKVVSLTHIGKRILLEKWNVSDKVEVIPCATDVDLFMPIESERSKILTIGYLGSIGSWYMLPEMLAFFKEMLKIYPNAKLQFLTPEAPESILLEAKKLNLSTERIDVKYVDRINLPNELSKIDIGLFFIKPVFSKQASSPVKQGEFMSMGIPVITNSGVGDTDEIINKYKSGILIKSFTESEYQNAAYKIPEMLNWDKTQIRSGALEYFSLQKGVESYFKIYESLTN